MNFGQKLRKVIVLTLKVFVISLLSAIMRKIRMWFGIILALIGVILLLQNTGVLEPGIWRIVWPLVLIIIGLLFILRPKEWKNRKHCPWLFGKRNEKEEE